MEKSEASIPLNCVDKALFVLHSKSDPMVLHCVLTMAGALDTARLRSALLAVMFRYPVLRSTIHAGLLKQVRKTIDVSGCDLLTVTGLETPRDGTKANTDQPGDLSGRYLFEWMNRPLDPTTDLPWRVLLLRKKPEEFLLVFAFHHSVTDGLGTLRFIAEVIEEYNGVTNKPLPPQTQDPPSGSLDELVALAQAHRRNTSHFYFRMMASLLHRFVICLFLPHDRICRDNSNPSPEIHFCQGALTSHELRQIQSRSRSAGTKVNDILLAACFRTVDQWNDVNGKPSRRVTIMVPVDVGRTTLSASGGNLVSFISVSSTRKERTAPDGLLHIVNRRTSRMIGDGTAFSVVYALRLCFRFPLLIPRLVARFLIATRVYLDSVLVTNLGLIRLEETNQVGEVKMGDAMITGVLGLPPVVSPMGVSLCIGTYNDRLQVALVYKTSQFSHAEAQLFLNLYLHEIRSYQRTPEGMLEPQVRKRATRETVRARQP